MLVLVGWAIVLSAVIGGFAFLGGYIPALWQPGEYFVIGGAALGYLVAGSPPALLKMVGAKIKVALTGSPYNRQRFIDLISMLYELLMIAREQGVMGIEDHVTNPQTSTIFSKYPSFLADHHAVAFMQDAMRPIIDGKVKGDQLKATLEADLNRIFAHNAGPVNVINKAADACPGMGIVAAVLGIVITMGSLGSGDKAEIGHHVASALTGTFLGILVCYGFLQPLALNIEFLNEDELAYYEAMGSIIVSYATGSPPIMAAEAGRRVIPPDRQPSSEELEQYLKSLVKKN